MNDVFKKYFKIFKNPKSLIIIGLIGIGLIFLSSIGNDKEKTPTQAENFSVEDYKAALEKDIKKLVKGITGSRKVTVVITLESSVNYNYAEITESLSEEKNEQNRDEQKTEQKQ